MSEICKISTLTVYTSLMSANFQAVDDQIDYLYKPATNFGIVAAESMVFLDGANQAITVFGMEVPLWAFLGTLGAAGSLAGAVGKKKLWSQLPARNFSARVANTGLNTVALVGGLNAAGAVGEISPVTLLAMAASGEEGGNYVCDTWVRPMLMAK